MSHATITSEQIETYRTTGCLVVRGLLPQDLVIDALVCLDRLLCAKLPSLSPSSRERVTTEVHAKILALKEVDRARLSEVYDALRKIAPFWSIVGGEPLVAAVRALLGSDVPGVVFRGCGIRLDLPFEDRWRSAWHQEYQSQVSAPNALVAWFNLVPVTLEMGPVQVAAGSHREGILPVRVLDPKNEGKDYTKTFEYPDVEARVARYRVVEYETEPGDVVFINFLTLHQSGWNRSKQFSRVTCQVRYFDMMDPVSIEHRWQGGWQDGGDFAAMHPDKVMT